MNPNEKIGIGQSEVLEHDVLVPEQSDKESKLKRELNTLMRWGRNAVGAVVFLTAMGCEPEEVKPTSVDKNATVELTGKTSIPENSPAGTYISHIEANDPDATDRIVSIEVTEGSNYFAADSENNLVVAEGANLDHETLGGRVDVGIEVTNDKGKKTTLRESVNLDDVPEETIVEETVDNYTISTIFDADTPFKVGTVKVKKVYSDQEATEDQLVSTEVIEVISEDYANWVKEELRKYEESPNTGIVQLESTLDTFVSVDPNTLEKLPVNPNNVSSNGLKNIVSGNRFFAAETATGFDETKDVSLGKIAAPIVTEAFRLYNEFKIDPNREWMNATNLFEHIEGRDLVEKIVTEIKMIAAEFDGDDRIVGYKLITQRILPQLETLLK